MQIPIFFNLNKKSIAFYMGSFIALPFLFNYAISIIDNYLPSSESLGLASLFYMPFILLIIYGVLLRFKIFYNLFQVRIESGVNAPNIFWNACYRIFIFLLAFVIYAWGLPLVFIILRLIFPLSLFFWVMFLYKLDILNSKKYFFTGIVVGIGIIILLSFYLGEAFLRVTPV